MSSLLPSIQNNKGFSRKLLISFVSGQAKLVIMTENNWTSHKIIHFVSLPTIKLTFCLPKDERFPRISLECLDRLSLH